MQVELVLDGVSKHYGDFVAVGDVSLSVTKGAIYGLLGPNGAGKSTILRMVNDILVPDTGSITLFGSLPPGRAASRRIGYLPEERGLYPKMRVVDLLQFFAELRGLTRADARVRARFWLDRLGISDWTNEILQSLSKGMQQKVQFATALIHEPELLILDEPWSGLDPINAEVLRDVVLEQKSKGRTVIFSTHLMEQAEKICDSVSILAKGRRVVEGRLDVLLANSNCRTITVELSSDKEEARRFLDASPSVDGVKVAANRFTVELKAGQKPQELLRQMVESGIEVKSFQPDSQSLHQIFVERVGGASTADRKGREVLGG